MQRHQGDARLGAVGVGVGDQGRVVEELGEGFAALLGVLRGVGQLLEVLDAGERLGRGLVFQRTEVAAAVVEELDELGEGGAAAGLAKGFAAGRRGFVVAVHENLGGALGCGLCGPLQDDRREGVECGGVDCLRRADSVGCVGVGGVLGGEGGELFRGVEVEAEVEAGVGGGCVICSRFSCKL